MLNADLYSARHSLFSLCKHRSQPSPPATLACNLPPPPPPHPPSAAGPSCTTAVPVVRQQADLVLGGVLGGLPDRSSVPRPRDLR